jgi:hypothetical protein
LKKKLHRLKNLLFNKAKFIENYFQESLLPWTSNIYK